MKTYNVRVISLIDGREVPAVLICCPDCESSRLYPTPFVLFQVEPGHLHLQCTECFKTFCDGKCK
jgi:hypothetical protein